MSIARFHTHLFAVLILLFAAYPAAAHAITGDADPERNDQQQRLAELAERFAGKGVDIKSHLNDSRFELYEGIGDRFRNSAERRTLTLDEYKRVLGYDAKKANITGFLKTHEAKLSEAEETYGIPRYVIAAIIGIESDFGKNIGRHNPFNAYASMVAVNYRAEFAEAQLTELMEFVNRHGIDVFELKSSYAGAMTFAQFIPYSLNKWFVGDDIFDMNNNIMSVGNYLAYFKERTGSLERSVFRYNPSQLYTDAVLSLARDAEALMN
ncbi:MAG: lytic murein transglycosylase [Balneolaceae bacterium]